MSFSFSFDLVNPPDPQFETVGGDKKVLVTAFDFKLPFWLRQIQFRIPAGYVSDGASVPRHLRWIYDRASLGTLAPLAHDWGCEWEGVIINLRGEVLQLPWYVVHAFFLVAMLLDGVPWGRAKNCFLAVLLGGPKWSQYSRTKVLAIAEAMVVKYPELKIFEASSGLTSE
jgi:hypothetical protein